VKRTSVWFTFSFEGFHRWPEAPEWCGFLSSRHRHLFNVRVEVPVSHVDRDIEFITTKRELSRHVADTWPGGELGAMSCEALAGQLAEQMIGRYGLGWATVEVDEDGENGARVALAAEVA
jgi:hypothetical protein